MACWREKATIDFDEQAARVMLRFNRPLPGEQFARHSAHIRADKHAARNRIKRWMTSWGYPKPLPMRMFSMPGLRWYFESGLIGMPWQEMPFRNHLKITAVEREKAVYLASLKYMPGARKGLTQKGTALSTEFVEGFHFSSFEDFSVVNEADFDLAWLDFTGPMRISTMDAIKRFWPHVTWLLVVTVLNARYDTIVGRKLRSAGGLANWLASELDSSTVRDEFDYGEVPMKQIILQKKSLIPAAEWVGA